MARLIDGNPAIKSLQRSVFSTLAARLKTYQGRVFPLHVGDTYLQPHPGAHLADQNENVAPGIHRYASPRGRHGLIEAIVEHRRAREPGIPIGPENVLVTTGATGGLATAVRALIAPGQRILLLGPRWPLIRGMSVSHGVTVTELPFYDRVSTAEEARELLESTLGDDLAAVYVNSPNNPSGVTANPEVVAAIADFACRHDLWVLADEVYEDIVYGPPATPLGQFADLRERLVRVFSFSKAFGMAGNRVGYVVADPSVATQLEQLATYLVYSVNTGGQRAAEVALREGRYWLESAVASYGDTGRQAAERLGVTVPDGGTFLFVDVADALDERGVFGFLEDCVSEGILVAPGSIFGAGYESYIRVCFTSVEPSHTLEGIDRLARRLGRG